MSIRRLLGQHQQHEKRDCPFRAKSPVDAKLYAACLGSVSSLRLTCLQTTGSSFRLTLSISFLPVSLPWRRLSPTLSFNYSRTFPLPLLLPFMILTTNGFARLPRYKSAQQTCTRTRIRAFSLFTLLRQKSVPHIHAR